MNMATVSLILVVVGTVVVVGNVFLYSRVASANTATAQELAARLEIAYSSLQRDIDKLEQLRHVDPQQGVGIPAAANSQIPAVVDCAGKWTSWGPCSQGCGQGTRSRVFSVTTVKHGPGGRDCPQPADTVNSRQCSLSDCADMADALLDRYCPGATCRAVVENGYCAEAYSHFCATHDGLAQPLPPPPGYTVASPGSQLCPVSCDATVASSAASAAAAAAVAGAAGNSHTNNAAADLLANAKAKPRSAASGGSGGAAADAAAGMSEAELITALQAVYPSDEVAAAGNYMGVHDPHVLELSDALGSLRAARVKAATKWNWDMYVKCAFGKDELLPQTCDGQDNWGGLGFTLVDALDTLWMMDLKDEFEQGRDWVASKLDFRYRKNKVSVFEVNIRVLGGLLAAYDLSGDKMFLDKSADLARRFFPAFATPTGLPYPAITLSSGAVSNSWTGDDSLLAELGTVQLEFRYLTHHTGDTSFREKAENVYKALRNKGNDGVFPTKINRKSGRASGVYTFGGLSDSFYEYLIKMWVQGGRVENQWRDAYDRAVMGMRHKLLTSVQVNGQKIAYVGSSNGRSIDNKMEHLTCFVPGMLALGAATSLDSTGSVAAADMLLAKQLAFTCHQMYHLTATGLSPEHVVLRSGRMSIGSSMYILRPEAAESMFVLHSLTGHPVFRQWAWEMFDAIDRNCKTRFGYGAHPNVGKKGATPDNRAESFFMAETLKYLYLIQLPLDHPQRPKLDEYVFNTEAHPLKVFGADWPKSTVKLY